MRIYPRLFGLFLMGLINTSLTMPVLAKTQTGEQPEFGGAGWLGALGILVFIGFAAYWCTKLLSVKMGAGQARNIKIADSLFLGTNRYLHLVLINNQVFLISSSEQGINLLKEFNDPDFSEKLQKNLSTKSFGTGDTFTNIFDSFMKKQSEKSESEGIAEFSEEKDRLREGLEKIRAWKRM